MDMERLAKVEEKVDSAHKRIDDVEEKKLSKHEFNGFQQVMDGVKHTFHDSIKELGKTTDKNTAAINNLQTTFSNLEKFMPKIFKFVTWLITGLASAVLGLAVFIATKLLGLW